MTPNCRIPLWCDVILNVPLFNLALSLLLHVSGNTSSYLRHRHFVTLSHLFISSFTRLEACLCLPAWFCDTAVCFISPSLILHPPPSPRSSIFHLYLSSSFSARFLCVIFYLPPALLAELLTNVPVRRLVKHLYSTLGCVITFNPVPFLFCSLSAEEEAVLRRFHRQCKERRGV